MKRNTIGIVAESSEDAREGGDGLRHQDVEIRERCDRLKEEIRGRVG